MFKEHTDGCIAWVQADKTKTKKMAIVSKKEQFFFLWMIKHSPDCTMYLQYMDHLIKNKLFPIIHWCLHSVCFSERSFNWQMIEQWCSGHEKGPLGLCICNFWPSATEWVSDWKIPIQNHSFRKEKTYSTNCYCQKLRFFESCKKQI